MTERWQRADRLFHEVVDLPPDERKKFLDQACAADPLLREEIESLIASDQSGDAFIDRPALGEGFSVQSTASSKDSSAESLAGQAIGPYQLVRPIATGGMGVVYLAVRADDEYENQVAIKLVKLGMDSEQILQRFRLERQTLAHLDHPNIAKLLDGGATSDGRPYLIMEYIDGIPITEYCDQHELSLAERLLLFEKVCSAVHYAHQNLVIHRDLKPANILVTTEGVPKLLDFGVAKVLSAETSEGTGAATAQASRLFTPEYASPEQLRGQPMTTACDVYALGVILYELLTGHRPYQLRHRSPGEIDRLVCDVDPEKPSAAASRVEQRHYPDGTVRRAVTPETVGRTRRIAPESLRRRLLGDLDNIVLMAMRKDPKRRYASAEQLYEDLCRYREGRPVLARKDTIRYRTEKFIKRNKVGVTAVLLVALSLLVGAVGVARETRRTRVQRDAAEANLLRAEQAELSAAEEAKKAREEADVARQAMEFMKDIFKAPPLSADHIKPDTAQDILERGAERLEENESDYHPVIRATLMDTIGWGYMGAGSYDRAQELIEQGLALRTEHYGENHTDVLESLESLATLRHFNGNYQGAIDCRRRGLAISRKLGGPGSMMLVVALSNLGTDLAETGDYVEAEALLTEALETGRRAESEGRKGKWNEAKVFLINNLAALRAYLGRHEEAEALSRELLEMLRERHGDEHPRTVDAVQNLGIGLLRQQRLSEAEPLLRESLAMRRKLFGPKAAVVGKSLHLLAMLERKQGDYVAAEAYCRQALDIRRAELPDGSPRVAETETLLAACLITLGRFEEAEPLLLNCYSVLEKARTLSSPITQAALLQLVELYEAWDKPEEAARWREKLPEKGRFKIDEKGARVPAGD
ncbi:MAG: serine/threonine-protein kinase [Phycisphaerales bacterium]|nr:serine/threonine-protein kinase [Phycisphaerales bacterium]